MRILSRCFSSFIVVLWVTGCPSPALRVARPVVSMQQAVDQVDANYARIGSTLRASGKVDGYFTQSDGTRRSYHLDGVLFYLKPQFVRFDLKAFGTRRFLFGSNLEVYWHYSGEDEICYLERHDVQSQLSEQIPLRPADVGEALGLVLREPGRSGLRGTVHVQRVVDDYQQILVVSPGAEGGPLIEREYWLDRSPPYLARRVVFRGQDGAVTMTSSINDYRKSEPQGAWLPYSVRAQWPAAGAEMHFRIQQWRWVDGVGPSSVQFQPPPNCVRP